MRRGQKKYQGDYGEQNQSSLPGFEADPNQSNATEEANKQTRAEKENEKPVEKPNFITIFHRTVFVGKAGAWTAIFTFVLAVFTYLLWQVSRDANQTSAATQAATVSSIGPGLTKIAAPDGKILKGYNVVFQWVNSGTTPTKTATLQSNIYTGNSIPNKDLDFSQLPQNRIVTAVIPPKAAIQLAPDFISLQDVEDVQQGKKHMFFWGWAVYHDIFTTTPRLSEYCFNIEGAVWTKIKHDDFSGDTQLITTPCGVHFCFNDDCEDYKNRTK